MSFNDARVFLRKTGRFVKVQNLAHPINRLLGPLRVIDLTRLLILTAFAVKLVKQTRHATDLAILLMLPVHNSARFHATVRIPHAGLGLSELTTEPRRHNVRTLMRIRL